MDSHQNQNPPQSEEDWEDDNEAQENQSDEEPEESAEQLVQVPVQKDEEEKLDPSWLPRDQIKHCSHYLRWCEKKAPCCGIFYPCRLCHNDQYRGPKGPGCKVETMDRTAVSEIKCKRCGEIQPPAKECVKCKISFGRYYCSKCKFWDDHPTKKIYHCDQCKMCRIGSPEENFHCEKCDICLSKSLQDSHPCTEKAFNQNCPVCLMNLKESTIGVQSMPNCRHWIHVTCFKGLCKSGVNRCPVCNTVLLKMSENEINMYDKLVAETKDKLPPEVKDLKIDIQCLECHTTSKDLDFHFYMKCRNCGSYNTKQ